jgi:serine/threonine protein phosphatase PrpC
LAFENKEKPINYIDFDNSSKEDDKSDGNLGENNSNNCSFEKEDKKIIINTQFKMPNKKSSDFSENDEDKTEIKTKVEMPHKKSSDFSGNEEDKKEVKKKEIKKGKKKKLKYKLKGDIKDFKSPPRKMSFEPKDDKLLNRNIIISSAITKPGLNDDVEKTNQDSYLIKENIFGENFNIYGVFDGHGDDGHFVSRYISKYISDYYTNEFNFIQYNSSLSKNKIFLERNQKIIRESIKELDTELTTTKIDFDIMHSGSTSVLLFLVDETLICSNIGDSQCYLFNCSNEDLWTFESLAKIHKPSNEEEKKRIIESGGEVHPYFDEDGIYDGPDRVYAKNQNYPGLSLSRSIGDLDGKDIGVISDPDIIVKKIDDNSKFIVLGSDGLFDVIKPYDISRIVRSHFNKGDIDGACKRLLNKAIQMWKKNNEERDDITIIIIFIGKPNILLKEEKNKCLFKINENVNEDSNRNNSSNQNPI